MTATDGHVIAEINKLCPDCRKHYHLIVARDNDAVVLQCTCGREWTAYFEPPVPPKRIMTV